MTPRDEQSGPVSALSTGHAHSGVLQLGCLSAGREVPAPRAACEPDADLNGLLHRSRQAQQSFARWPEEATDALLTALADVMVRSAEELAERTVAETEMGCAPDKAVKNRFAASGVLKSLVGRTGCGVLGEDADHPGVTEIAAPVGVVLALMPLTNPVATLTFSVLIALKARNALVVRAHRRAAGVTDHAVRLLRSALVRRGAPADLVQAVRTVDREHTGRLLRHAGVDLVLVTGGADLVRAACAAGRPTLAAGAGNAPAWISDDADVETASEALVESKSFDYGMICGSEQHLVVDHAVRDRLVRALAHYDALVLSREQSVQLGEVLFVGGRVRRELIGKSAQILATAAGLQVEQPTRLLVALLPPAAACSDWGKERLVPVLGLYEVSGERQAHALCRDLLARGGLGHTAAVHTTSPQRALEFARAVPASRVLVNAPASQGCIGLGTGLVPSLTLACGTAGGTTTTDNITYRHLQNITRVARWNR